MSVKATRPTSLAEKALVDAGMPVEVAAHILAIQQRLDESYRRQASATAEALQRQGAAIERLAILVQAVLERLPPPAEGAPLPVLTVAPEGAEPDLATLPDNVAADPIAAGYRLSQTDVARILRCPQGAISVLVRELGLHDDLRFAVQVRAGKRPIVNYHMRVIDRLLELIDGDDQAISAEAARELRRIRRAREGIGPDDGGAPSSPPK